MFTYVLIDGGYDIYEDEICIIHQPHSPNRGLTIKMTEAEATQIAELLCEKLSAGLPPVVFRSEESTMIQAARNGAPRSKGEIRAMVVAVAAALNPTNSI